MWSIVAPSVTSGGFALVEQCCPMNSAATLTDSSAASLVSQTVIDVPPFEVLMSV